MYGTAWKKEKTQRLVEEAVKSGFRGIDTACQPKHYFEPGVGDALETLYNAKVITRDQLFLQSKFTSLDGQDPNKIPYDRNAALSEQVRQSVQASLKNLKTDYLDSLVMHSPMRTIADTLQVWRVFEEFYKSGTVKRLGLSNTYDLTVLKAVFEAAEVKPTVLQNRFYAQSGYDVKLREYCAEHGIQYQSFWTLTANPHIVSSNLVKQLAEKYGKSKEQIFFRFIQLLGIVPLSGTQSPQHMLEDVAVETIPLQMDEVEEMKKLL